MSDNAQPVASAQPEEGPQFGFIRGPREFWGGVVLIGLAVFAIWASWDLPGMRGFAFGPGTGPRMFAGLMLVLGAAISITGIIWDGPRAEQYSVSGPVAGTILVVAYVAMAYYGQKLFGAIALAQGDTVIASILVLILAFLLLRFAPRGPIFLTASILVFAGTVRPLGMVLSTFVTILASAMATDDVHWKESFVWGAALTAFCAGLFPYALNLPLPLGPPACRVIEHVYTCTIAGATYGLPLPPIWPF